MNILSGLCRIGVVLYASCDSILGVWGGGAGDGALLLAITVLLITISMFLPTTLPALYHKLSS